MVNIVLSAVGSVLVIFYFVVCIAARGKYTETIEEINGDDYFLKELYFVGFQLMAWFSIDFNSNFVQKKIRLLSELYGIKEAKKLVIYDFAAQITYVVITLPIALFISVIANDYIMFGFVMVAVLLLCLYVDYDKRNKVSNRHDKISVEFPHVLSQLALLVNAGMPLKDALAVSSAKPQGILVQEIQQLVDDMNNGIPDYVAFSTFADRCGVDSVRKFASLMSQNVKKGSSELAVTMMELSNEIWRNRVSAVKEQGEKASTRLLIPIMIIFIGILVMVAVPMFQGLSFG